MLSNRRSFDFAVQERHGSAQDDFFSGTAASDKSVFVTATLNDAQGRLYFLTTSLPQRPSAFISGLRNLYSLPGRAW